MPNTFELAARPRWFQIIFAGQFSGNVRHLAREHDSIV
jgi:hypothetical protein